MRRAFVAALVGLASWRAYGAASKRIGILADSAGPQWDEFRKALSALGHRESENLTFEWRWAEGDIRRFPGLARDLVKLKVDVIVTEGTPAVRAARNATSAIPIVMAIAGDPLRLGLVKMLSRPGGNVTGSSSRSPDLHAKQIRRCSCAPSVSGVDALRMRHSRAFPERGPRGAQRVCGAS